MQKTKLSARRKIRNVLETDNIFKKTVLSVENTDFNSNNDMVGYLEESARYRNTQATNTRQSQQQPTIKQRRPSVNTQLELGELIKRPLLSNSKSKFSPPSSRSPLHFETFDHNYNKANFMPQMAR